MHIPQVILIKLKTEEERLTQEFIPIPTKTTASQKRRLVISTTKPNGKHSSFLASGLQATLQLDNNK